MQKQHPAFIIILAAILMSTSLLLAGDLPFFGKIRRSLPICTAREREAIVSVLEQEQKIMKKVLGTSYWFTSDAVVDLCSQITKIIPSDCPSDFVAAFIEYQKALERCCGAYRGWFNFNERSRAVATADIARDEVLRVAEKYHIYTEKYR